MLIAACSESQEPPTTVETISTTTTRPVDPSPDGIDVAGSWILVSATDDGEQVDLVQDVTGPLATVQLDDSSISGDGPCNEFNGRYDLRGNELHFDEVVVTARACGGETPPSDLSEFEDFLFSFFFEPGAVVSLSTDDQMSWSKGQDELVWGR